MTAATNHAGLVIMDLDGTLFHTETASIPAVRQAFRELHLDEPPLDGIQDSFGRTQADFHALLTTHCPPELASRLVALVDRLELVHIATQGALYPGVQETLKQLRDLGFSMAICSNGYPGYVDQVVRAHGLAGFFARVRRRSSPGDHKPAMVAELLTDLRPGRALVVGDRGDDVEAAHLNGLLAVAAAYGYGTPQEMNEADAVVTTPSELPAIVQKLLGATGAA
jgi:phosphoglycolate phosphatase